MLKQCRMRVVSNGGPSGEGKAHDCGTVRRSADGRGSRGARLAVRRPLPVGVRPRRGGRAGGERRGRPPQGDRTRPARVPDRARGSHPALTRADVDVGTTRIQLARRDAARAEPRGSIPGCGGADPKWRPLSRSHSRIWPGATTRLDSAAMADRGSFHLGRAIDPQTGEAGSDEVVVGSSDLTTHGVIVGMTGSGKTGLAIVLIEEALRAGIPAFVLDPKGDMTNLALVFPDLAPASFRPWVSEAEAQAAGVSVDEYAARQATIWREGLAASGIGPERLQELRDAADVTVYTPGSTAGVPLDVVGSLRVPRLSWESDEEALRDEIQATVTGLLALVGIQADPLASREHVLLSNLIEHAWRAGRDLDLGTLIGEVQSPPIRKLGVFELDQFFPPADRTKLAFTLNSLVASPQFSAWGEGEPLDPQRLLFTADGKPRCAVVYLAHLSEEERQFVVTLVFSKLVTWMRGQEGTPDLRALAYMDEVFGYVPPSAAPPAKKPILTIFKQGRAFGMGLVLSTQNPVDLDYKAMSNAGTWLVGRLQTENDKARVLEGLRSAAGGTDVAALDKAIGALGKRQFLLVSARSSTPRLLATRWAMSYLCGPLTKDQVARLGQASEGKLQSATSSPASGPVGVAAPAPEQELAADESQVAPSVAAGVHVSYLDPAAPWASAIGAVAGTTRLRAFLAARVALRYDDSAAG